MALHFERLSTGLYRVYRETGASVGTVRKAGKEWTAATDTWRRFGFATRAQAAQHLDARASGRSRTTYPFHLHDPKQIPAADRDEGPRRKAEQEAARARLGQTSEAYRRAVQNLQRNASLTNRLAADRLRDEYAAAETSFTLLMGNSRTRTRRRSKAPANHAAALRRRRR